MKGMAIILNVLVPGVGSFLIGKVGQGIAQVLLWGVGFLITVGTLGFGVVIGAPLMIGAWIWAIITAAGGPNQQITVQINDDRK